MRIVHAAHYSLRRNGTEFFNCEFKFLNGLSQNGHYVYPYSINDRARDNPLGTKRLGIAKANRGLIETCANIRPELLLLGHAQYIKPATLAHIRTLLPHIKIALWYVDPVYQPKDYAHLLPKIPHLDALYLTTAGQALDQFRTNPSCQVQFIPNPADSNIERLQSDLDPNPKTYDLLFIGSDKGETERKAFLQALQTQAKDRLKLKFAGCLGQPAVWGDAKERLLSQALMALNHSRRNDLELYSSDRIVQLAGNGLCTFSPASSGLQKLYRPDLEMVFYRDLEDLIRKATELARNPQRARAIGTAGRLRTHQDYSAKRIAERMVEIAFRRPD